MTHPVAPILTFPLARAATLSTVAAGTQALARSSRVPQLLVAVEAGAHPGVAGPIYRLVSSTERVERPARTLDSAAPCESS